MHTIPIRIGITDDHSLFRKTVIRYLNQQPNIEVIVETSSYENLISLMNTSVIDVLLLDVYMKNMSGLEALQIIKKRFAGLKIVVLTMCRDFETLTKLLSEDVQAFISKGDEPEELLKAIQVAANGKIYSNDLFAEVLHHHNLQLKKTGNRKNGDSPFTNREKEIIALIWEGKSNKEISAQLFLGIRSIEKIRQDIKSKIGVKSTLEVIKYALKEEIIYSPVRRL